MALGVEHSTHLNCDVLDPAGGEDPSSACKESVSLASLLDKRDEALEIKRPATLRAESLA